MCSSNRERSEEALSPEPSVDAAEQADRPTVAMQAHRVNAGRKARDIVLLENGGEPDQRVTRPWRVCGPAGARVLVGALRSLYNNVNTAWSERVTRVVKGHRAVKNTCHMPELRTDWVSLSSPVGTAMQIMSRSPAAQVALVGEKAV